MNSSSHQSHRSSEMCTHKCPMLTHHRYHKAIRNPHRCLQIWTRIWCSAITTELQNDRRSVAYYSNKLTGVERGHSATELEAMSVVMSIRHWASYLRIAKFTALVNHHALVFLFNKPAKTNNRRILHWISDLLEFHFDVVHLTGKLHLDADAVSKHEQLFPSYSIRPLGHATQA